MRPLWRRALRRPGLAVFFALILTLMSCARDDKGSQRFLLPWPNENGEAELQVVTIESLGSPYQLEGAAAKIYYQSGFSNSGFLGEPAKPQLTLSNGIFVPMNVESSLGLVLYAHMERLQSFDVSLGVDGALPWPRHLGYEMLVHDPETLELEFNNARYFLDWDVITFLPMSSEHTPLAVNPGIVAHEHFHAHFNFRVLKQLENKLQVSAVERFNHEVILRGWNEGLADYYGFVYSKNPEALSMSFGESTGGGRKISLEEPVVIRSAKFHQSRFDYQIQRNKPVRGLGYSVGTDIARTLFWLVESAGKNAELSSHEEMLKHVTDRLEKLPSWYSEKAPEAAMEPAALFELLFFDETIVLDKSQCSVLRKTGAYAFSKEFLEAPCL